MAKERETLNLDDTIDLEELTGITSKPQYLDKAQIDKIAEKTGFTSRQPRPRRSRTKYKAQLNIKVREGIRPLFQEISSYLETFDNETFELALLALIEKKGTKEHLQHFKDLMK